MFCTSSRSTKSTLPTQQRAALPLPIHETNHSYFIYRRYLTVGRIVHADLLRQNHRRATARELYARRRRCQSRDVETLRPHLAHRCYPNGPGSHEFGGLPGRTNRSEVEIGEPEPGTAGSCSVLGSRGRVPLERDSPRNGRPLQRPARVERRREIPPAGCRQSTRRSEVPLRQPALHRPCIGLPERGAVRRISGGLELQRQIQAGGSVGSRRNGSGGSARFRPVELPLGRCGRGGSVVRSIEGNVSRRSTVFRR